jgi:phosphatidylglycerophosphatase A
MLKNFTLTLQQASRTTWGMLRYWPWWALQIATFFGIGKWPKMPGTWATLAALPLAYILMQLNPLAYMGAVLFLLFLGVLACEVVEASRKTHDEGDLVIDEVVGLLVAMTWLPITWQSFFFSFILFRLLDIAKPFPVSFLDKRIKGGLGVMLDDVAAGIMTNVILQIMYTKTSWLGSQVVTV